MKKNIGASPALYPCPIVVIGAMVDGKPSWTLAGHAGIIGHGHLMVSLVKAHYINKGIRENKILSFNIPDASWIKEADRMGTVSGNKADKSEAFSFTIGENGAPLIDNAKVSMECAVEENCEVDRFDNFICRILATYAEDEILNEKEKIDYDLFKPVLFEYPTYEYYLPGEKIGNCGKMN